MRNPNIEIRNPKQLQKSKSQIRNQFENVKRRTDVFGVCLEPWLIRNVSLFRDSSCVLQIFIFGLVMFPSSAFAHEQAGAAAGFVAGLAHPVSGLDHVIAMVAVGLWGAQLGTPAVFLLPVAFPMVMAFGGMLGLIGIPVPGIEIGIAMSAIVLGAAVLSSAQPRLWVALVVVGCFAIFHGHAHGTELPAGQSGLLYSIGFVVATGSLHACGICIGLVYRWPMGRVALRAAGAMVSIAGMVFLWRAVS